MVRWLKLRVEETSKPPNKAIAVGADVNAKDDNGETPLNWAIFNDETVTANLLRKHGGKTGEELKAAGK